MPRPQDVGVRTAGGATGAGCVEPRFLRTHEDVRRYVEQVGKRTLAADPSVKRWHFARCAALFSVLCFAMLQYYFFSVGVTILSMPTLTVFSSPLG
jgi:hypothetical protein